MMPSVAVTIRMPSVFHRTIDPLSSEIGRQLVGRPNARFAAPRVGPRSIRQAPRRCSVAFARISREGFAAAIATATRLSKATARIRFRRRYISSILLARVRTLDDVGSRLGRRVGGPELGTEVADAGDGEH